MDTGDDLTYLNYLRDKNDTFLLQSTDEALGVQDPTLNGQTFFGEIDDGPRIWTIDGLPVLLNGSVRPEGNLFIVFSIYGIIEPNSFRTICEWPF